MCYSIAETGNTLDNFAQGGADIEYMDAPVFRSGKSVCVSVGKTGLYRCFR